MKLEDVAQGMNNLLLTREHPTLAARKLNLARNLLAYHGGEPYVHARLSRFPAESDVDFLGDPLTASTGRRERASLRNYARRIARKVPEYVFGQPVTRTGGDPAFFTDATATGMSLEQFMFELISMLIVCRWAWIGVDRPPAQPGRSLLDRERAGDRIYWKLYSPLDVKDWQFNPDGSVAWALTEETVYDCPDPRKEAEPITVRYLFEPGQTTRIETNTKGTSTESVTETGHADVGIVPVGLLSPAVWWFDDVERIQRAILDKQSTLDTAIFKSVFPLLVVPASLAEQARMEGDTSAEARRKIGIGNPIVETPDESGTTRWVSGVSADLKLIREEIQADAAELMEIVGLNMSVPESRQVASAESKAWDHLDVGAVLANYAAVAEEAERKAVALSVSVGGGTFQPWDVKYARSFDIRNFAADMQGIVSAGGLALPPKGEKILQRAAIRMIAKEFGADDAELRDALMEVDQQPDQPETPDAGGYPFA